MTLLPRLAIERRRRNAIARARPLPLSRSRTATVEASLRDSGPGEVSGSRCMVTHIPAGQRSATNPGNCRGTASALGCAAMLARLKVKLSVLAVGLGFGTFLQLQAVDRWSALSQMESGDDDDAVGGAGEISRYQIRPEVWRRYAPPEADWRKPDDALSVAREAMRDRCAAFERAAHRPPTDFEFYILWNAPAQIRRPGKAVCGRAERFCNLVSRR